MLPDLASLAGVLYGGTQTPTQDAATPASDAPRSDGELAAVLFDNIKDGGYAQPLADQLDRLSDEALIGSDEQRAEVLEAAHSIFQDADIPPAEAARLFDLYAAGVREPPTDEQFDGWETESRRLVREAGPDGAERLELARRYIASRPQLRDALNATGLGSHPQVVALFLERGRSLGGKVKP